MNRARITALLPAVLATALLSGCGTGTSNTPSTPKPADSGIGAWPTFLPSASPEAQARGSATTPALSYAGSPVVIDLGGDSVTVNVQGPSYPADTKVGADAVRCTFTVVLSGSSRDLDLAGARFDVLDHNGTTHVLRPAAGGALTGTVRPAQTVTLKLATVVPSGEGLLRYAPDGEHTAAAWDYVAETD